MVESEMYHIEREMKRKFLATGDIQLPGSAAVTELPDGEGLEKKKTMRQCVLEHR
jgi:hypothetical protein